jgi:hypothetical protein
MPRFVLILAVLSVTAGCATPYQPLGDSGGYADEKVGEGTYNLVYVASGETDVMEIYRMWHRRATELCGSDKYDHDVTMSVNTGYADLQTPVSKRLVVSNRVQLLRSRSVEGTVKCR